MSDREKKSKKKSSKSKSSKSEKSVPSASSVRDLVKNKLIGLFDEFSQQDDKWKVLIVDDDALKVISVACRVRDIMQKNITSMDTQFLFDNTK